MRKKYLSFLGFLSLVVFTASFSFNKKPKVQAIIENDLLRAADIQKGRELTSDCRTCHSFEKNGPVKLGATLFGVVGSPIASVKGFEYSGALVTLGQQGKIWTTDELYSFLRNPNAYAPGTKMRFKGMLDPQDRMDLIAYLITLK